MIETRAGVARGPQLHRRRLGAEQRRRRSRAATRPPATSSRPRPRPRSTTCPPRSRRRGARSTRPAGRPPPARNAPRSSTSSPASCARSRRALAELVAREMGKPIRYVREREIEPAIDRILFYAGAARLIRGEVTSSGARPSAQPRAEGAGRRVRAHHAVERPGRSAAAQDRRGDRDRLHVRAQAGQRRAGVVDGDLRAARPDRGPAAGRGQRRRRPGRGHRRGARRRSARRQDQLHRQRARSGAG